MWFAAEPVPIEFTEESPFHVETLVLVAATPARVFEILATAEGMEVWFQDFVACRWASGERGVGAEREIELALFTVRERFLVWEPGRRLAFRAQAVTLPLATAIVEDFVLEPVGTATQLTWRVHYRPSLPMRLVHPLGRRVFREMFRTSADGLSRYARLHPTSAISTAR